MWPVSFVDGAFQVADADGVHYPLTMQHIGLAAFNPGWTPRGLQTGLPPFHVLELVHADGQETFWFMDELLDYRGNAVVHLNAEDRTRYFEAVEPLAREIFEQAVAARHPAVPAASHHFDGFLASSTRELLAEAVARVVPRPDVVRPGALRDVGRYGRNGVSLGAARIEELLGTAIPVEGSDVIELGAHRALRGFDEAAGTVFYLLQGTDPADRHLYVPGAGAVFGDGDPDHDPVLPLVLYYATHLDRAVPLPEIEDIGFDLVEPHAPPQHGLDEPPAIATPDHEAFAPAAPEPGEPAATGPGTAASDPAAELPEPAIPAGHDPDPDPDPRPVLSREPELAAAEPYAPPPRTSSQAEHWTEAGRDAPPARPGAGDRQNWWQRLLGLGNP